MEAIFQVRLLGLVQVERNGEPVRELKSRKALALLGYLAAQGQPMAREHLADLFWGDKTEARGRANLSWTLNRISAQLPGCLQADRHTIQFQRAAPYRLDLAAFAELEAQGEAASLAAAAELYRGEFLEGLYLAGCAEFEIWLVKERERWRQRVARVLGELVTHRSQRGQYQQGLHFAQRLLTLAPWQEETHRQVMRLLAYSGQRSEALAQYETCCGVLAEELDVEPAAATTKLYEQIRDGELEIPVSPSDRVPDLTALPPFFLDKVKKETVERPVFVARHHELDQLNRYLDQALAGQGQVVFVTGDAGQGKTALIQEFARRAQVAHSNLIVASGNGNAYTGVGDPYLPFREILSLLTGDVEARWTAGVMTKDQAQRLWHLLPLTVQALLEVGPDLLELFVPGASLVKRVTAFRPWPEKANWLPRLEELLGRKALRQAQDTAAIPGDPNLRQSALFDQYTQVLRTLARQRSLLLVLDDLQWADAGSANLLFHLGRQIGGDCILVVGAFRPTEIALGRPASPTLAGGIAGRRERHPLEPVVNEFKRYFGDIEVDLEQAEDRQFVDALLDTQPNQLGDAFRGTLYGQTGGHPLFTVELLQGMQERGDLVQDEAGRWIEGATLDWETLPARVEAVIAERIGRLPEQLRDALTAASVEGETFTAEVVAWVGATDVREMVERLSGELDRRHRLVRAQGVLWTDGQRLSRYRFRHILFQKYHYNTLDSVERAHLHQAVGTALEALYGEGEEEIAAIVPQLARHFQEAGVAKKAIDYLCRAGDRARGLYAHEEAIDYYQRALAFLKEQGDAGREQAARTLMKLGLTYHTAFDFQQAHQAYEEGFALWQRAGEIVPAIPPPAPHALRVSWLNPPTLDPTMAWDTTSAMVIDLLFSGLLELSPEMEVVPGVAQSWEVLEGGRKYIFQLRDDVQWSDGTPVTARDFEYAWKRVLDPATESPSASKLFDVKSARAFHQGEMSDPNQVGVQALDAVTLAVELEEPTGYFLHLLAHHISYPVPQHVVAAYGETWAAPENIVTNGPFRLETWRQDESMVLLRHTEHHGRFKGNLQRVELSLLSDWSARFELYKADGLDVFELWRSRSPEEMASARHQHTGDYVTAPSLVTMYVGFDVSQPPLDDARVRRAFGHAVDRETLAGVLMRGYVFPATGGFVPPGMPGHSAGIGFRYDPDQAQRLLAEAGYPKGGESDFPRVELLTFHGGESRAEYLQAQWRENLGIEVTVQSMEFGMLLEKLDSESPSIFLIGWGADYPDPDDFLRVCPARGWTGWQNEVYTGLVEKAKRVTNQGERIYLYQKADQILVEAAAVMPLTYGRQHWLVKPWVRKFLTPAMYTSCFWKDVIIEAH